MPVIRTRIFQCVSSQDINDSTTKTNVMIADVNAFTASLPNLGDTLDVQYTSYPILGMGGLSNLRHVVTVVYVGV
jgi:hypothetical protein